MKAQLGQRFLVIYSGMLTAVFAVCVLSGFVSVPKKMRVDELDVQRINLVEPDGTLRMVISDKARFPGYIFRGEQYPHPNRSTAGMLFFNDEGTENGGLIFGGRKDADGKIVDAGGSLTFDKYNQDQLVQLVGNEDSSGKMAGLLVSDRPDRSILDDFKEQPRLNAMPDSERRQLMAQRLKENYYGSTRIMVGRNDKGAAQVSLRDAAGHPRIVLSVAADGASGLQFLDADGKVVQTVAPPVEH
jgi:hypothetical protein